MSLCYTPTPSPSNHQPQKPNLNSTMWCNHVTPYKVHHLT